MAELLKKLKRAGGRLKGGAQASVSVPFELTCECGSKVTGMRRATWIEAECQSCCQSLFVLPANPYPSTKSVPSEVLGGNFSERFKSVARELFPKKDSPVRDTKKTDRKAAAMAATAPTPAVPKFRFPRIDIAGFLKRVFTPFRLLMLAIIAVLGLTVSWMTSQRAIEAARQGWLKTPELVEQLLQKPDLPGLEEVLKDGIAAATVLQKNDAEWRRLRNLLNETVAINSLANSDLLAGFHDAYDENGLLKDDAGACVTAVCNRGPFVFDTALVPDSGLSDDYLIEFPATPGRHPVHIIVPLPELATLQEQTGDRRAIFAAEIQTVQAPRQRSFDPWVLTLKPGSFVLLTSQTHCNAIGLTSEFDPTLPSILQRQRDFVEGSETWHSSTENALPDPNVRGPG